MARNRLRGDSPPVAQVSQFTVTGAGTAGDSVLVKISNKTVTGTVPVAPTTTTTAAAIVTALSAATFDEFTEVVWSSVGAVVYGTAGTAGVPFTIDSVSVTGTVTVSAVSTPTTSAGPNHWDDPLNWSAGTVPANTEDVDLQDSDTDLLYGLGQSLVTLNSLNIYSTYTGKIGLPDYSGAYYEYRPTELAIGATTITVGEGDGDGSALMRLNTGSTQTSLIVKNTSTPSTQGTPALWWKGTHASNAAVVTRGSVGLGYRLGDAATLASLKIGSQGGSTDAIIYGGAALSLTALTQVSGRVSLLGTLGTIAIDDGVLTLAGTGISVTTFTGRGGYVYFDGTGTVTNSTIGTGCVLDLSRDPRTGKTFTNITCNAGSGLDDRNKVATFTNGPIFNCKLSEMKVLDLGDLIQINRL